MIYTKAHCLDRSRPPRRNLTLLIALAAIAHGAPQALPAAERETTAAAVERRLANDAKYLSSDKLEGRGVGAQGLDLAAEFIAREMAATGLKTDLYEGTPFQRFQMSVSTRLGPKEENHLVITTPDSKTGKPLQLGVDFNPLAMGSAGKVKAPLVFVGYGITAPEHGYDDYQGVDVKGKVVVILRKEPQQANPHSKFEGTQHSRHAWFSTKLSNAYRRGAAAVVFVNDQFSLSKQAEAHRKSWREALDKLAQAIEEFRKLKEPTEEQLREHAAKIEKLSAAVKTASEQLRGEVDRILAFSDGATAGGQAKLPVFFVRREVIDPIIKQSLGKDLASLEKEIDGDLKPRSRPLENVILEGQASLERKQVEVKNVIGVLEGEGPLADETVVIGGHYDHLGMGGRGSRARGKKAIHNGADDNASGIAVMLEVARRLAANDMKPRRRVVFIAFTAEESGLIGSQYYVRNPLVPLEKTVAMLNLDMVGRLEKERLLVNGTGTAAEFDALMTQLGKKHGFDLKKSPSGFGPSDHSAFYGKKIPAMHFFTGAHKDYHTPDDDFHLLNIEGMRRITDLLYDTAVAIIENPKRPQYRQTKAPRMARGRIRVYFGSRPDYGYDKEGCRLSGVAPGGPAEKAGLKAGDIIIKMGQDKVGNVQDLAAVLSKLKPGETVKVVVRRDGKEVAHDVKVEAIKR